MYLPKYPTIFTSDVSEAGPMGSRSAHPDVCRNCTMYVEPYHMASYILGPAYEEMPRTMRVGSGL